MSKIFSFVLSFVFIGFVSSQDLDKSAALQLISNHAASLNINIGGDDMPKITNAYTDADRGLTYVYVQQNYKNINLYNVIKTTVFKQNILQSQEGDFVADIANRTNQPIPVISASGAISLAAQHLELPKPTNLTELENTFIANKKFIYSSAGIAKKNINVELVWCSTDDSKSFQLAWNVSIDVLNSSDYWNVRVDAATGKILEKNNYTVYEKANTPTTHTCVKKNILEKKEKKLNINSLLGIMSPPPTTTNASYRVVAYPKENALAGVTVENNPWLKAGTTNNATTYGWHFDGTDNFECTAGNNVYAYDDSANINVPGRFDTSTTASPSLTFNRVPKFTLQPTTLTNRLFATDNLFYWNNIIHDLMYQYGFTEAGGNFQADNMSRGGNGGDYVNAQAQDGGGVNNANFSTPPDGNSGRMQMYLWTYSTNPRLDGDLDNGIIAHEFTHGISNRLTGGPSTTSCLQNYEQGGEGWSDYVALMVTTNWATALTTDGTKSRPIGNYVIKQPATYKGIRTFPYSTDMSINPHTYLDVSDTIGNPSTTTSGAHIPNATEVHYIGEVWCSVLWDMTWNIIQQVGTINTNLYDATGGGGNTIALNLVMQGMKFQKCSPGFLDARNAILKADSILYNGAYRCSIWSAFARRGMGYSAIQGSALKTTDQTEAYDMPPFPKVPTITLAYTNILQGQTVVPYTCSSVFGATGYQWSYTGSNAIINNNGNKSVTVDFGANATSGDLQVVATSTSACSSAVAKVAIVVNPVPVVFTSFTAEKAGKVDLIKWSTSTEINSKNFEVQRSVDGVTFNTLGNVAAKGNSTVTSNYSFIDAEPVIGINYYRLKQVDINGKFVLTPVKSVKFDNNTQSDVSLFPNPAKEMVTIECKDMKDITILDYLGKVVINQKGVNQQQYNINVKGLSKGTYLVQVKTIKGEVKTEKLIVE